LADRAALSVRENARSECGPDAETESERHQRRDDGR